jgi:hypothetical protein
MAAKMKNKLIESSRKANRIIQELKTTNSVDDRLFYQSMREYIKLKFMLDEEDFTTEKIIDLAKISLSKQLNINYNRIKKVDVADCSGATTSMIKKTLLIMSLEKRFDISFFPFETAEIENIRQLCEAILRKSDIMDSG